MNSKWLCIDARHSNGALVEGRVYTRNGIQTCCMTRYSMIEVWRERWTIGVSCLTCNASLPTGKDWLIAKRFIPLKGDNITEQEVKELYTPLSREVLRDGKFQPEKEKLK